MLAIFKKTLPMTEVESDYNAIDLPNEIWLHIFSFLCYTEYCCVRLVCRRFYYITKEPTLSPQPAWSKASIQKRRRARFRCALSQPVISLEEIRSLSWKGVPPIFRSTVFQLLLGYLPCETANRSQILQEKRQEYRHFLQRRNQNTRLESHQEFKNLLNRDLSRLIPVDNEDLTRIIQSCLEVFNIIRRVPYNSTGMSIHFPLIHAAYIQKVIEHYNLVDGEPDDFVQYLTTKLPLASLEELEADFFWCLSISFDSLKVQGSYSESNRCDQSFILKLLSQVDTTLRNTDPALTDYFVDQGIFSRMYLHPWLATAFSQSFPLSLVLRFWDSLLSESRSNSISIELLVYICVAIVLHYSTKLKQLTTDDITEFLRDVGNILSPDQGEMVLAKAYLLMKTAII